MNKMTRGFSYLLAVNFEVLVVIFGAWGAAKWLDAEYPQSFRWLMVTVPLAFIVIAHSFYAVIRALMRLDSQSKSGDEIEKTPKSSGNNP
ncbi:MAG: hypothetical protein RIQ81_439 [Pseudomonadota bacterium]|jgi:hypothetical protein